MRTALLASLFALCGAAVALAQAAPPSSDAEAEKAKEREAAAAALAACDAGAAAPLEPGTNAAPVFFGDLYSRWTLSPDAQARLKGQCEAALAADPGNERLRYQHLRVLYFGIRERPDWLSRAIEIAAESGRADAAVLYAIDVDSRLIRDDPDPDLPSKAVGALRRAADAGHIEGLYFLGLRLSDRASRYPYAPRGAAEAFDKLAALSPDAVTGSAESIAQMRRSAGLRAARLRLEAPGFDATERAAGFATLKAAHDAGDRSLATALAGAMRRGDGTTKRPEDARSMLEAAQTDAAAQVDLADMLLKGEGGPADRKRAFAILKSEKLVYQRGRNQLLASLYLDDKFPGPNPRAALAALETGFSDGDTDLRIAALLAQTKLTSERTKGLGERLRAAARQGRRDAATALARLALADHSAFRDLDAAREALAPFAAQGDEEARLMLAALQFSYLSSSSYQPTKTGGMSDDDIRQIVERGVAASAPLALLLRGQLQRRGAIYPQDDRAATQDLVRAAELGDLTAMHLAGKAYDDKLGVAKNPRERLRWWREAAQRGHLDSRESLASAFTFDSFDRLMTLREGVTEPIILWANGLGFRYGDSFTRSLGLSSLFSGSRIREAPPSAVAAAVLEGLRLSPAAADDARLVALGRALPDELRLDIERALSRRGLLKAAPDGFFGPQARAAMIAFIEAGEPLEPAPTAQAAPAPAATSKATAVAAVAPAPAGGLDKEAVDRARDRAFKAAMAAKTDKDRRKAAADLSTLARYGDGPARWAIMRSYHRSSALRQAVSAEEMTRYALDILASKPQGVEKADFEFIFNLSQMYQDRRIAAFARAFVEAMRDDARLRDPLELGGLLSHVRMSPGGCDALAAEARRLKIAASEDCSGPIVEALIDYAGKAGETGAPAKARSGAEGAVRAMSQ